MKCKVCDGAGWYADHAPDCDGHCHGCPIQVQCKDCEGTGSIEELKPKTINP